MIHTHGTSTFMKYIKTKIKHNVINNNIIKKHTQFNKAINK